MDDIVTVNYLLNFLQKASDHGFGDAKIKCEDGYLHEDEVSISIIQREIRLKGYLHHYPIAKKVLEFKEDIEKAASKFYGFNEKYSMKDGDVDDDIG